MKRILYLGLTILLCSCGFTPYYTKNQQQSLQRIYVEPIESLEGAALQASLVRSFSPTMPADFSLKISLTKTKTDLVVKADSDVQRIRVKLVTQYQLKSLSDGSIIKTGQIASGDSYDMPKQAYIELLSEEYVVRSLVEELASKYTILLSNIN